MYLRSLLACMLRCQIFRVLIGFEKILRFLTNACHCAKSIIAGPSTTTSHRKRHENQAHLKLCCRDKYATQSHMKNAFAADCVPCILFCHRNGIEWDWMAVHCIFRCDGRDDIDYAQLCNADDHLSMTPLDMIVLAPYNLKRLNWLMDMGYPKATSIMTYDYNSCANSLWAYSQGFVAEVPKVIDCLAHKFAMDCMAKVVLDARRNDAAVMIQRMWTNALSPYTRLGRRVLIRRSLLWCPASCWLQDPIGAIRRKKLQAELLIDDGER